MPEPSITPDLSITWATKVSVYVFICIDLLTQNQKNCNGHSPKLRLERRESARLVCQINLASDPGTITG